MRAIDCNGVKLTAFGSSCARAEGELGAFTILARLLNTIITLVLMQMFYFIIGGEHMEIVSCTACGRQINHFQRDSLFRHPVLKVLVCKVSLPSYR